MVARDLLGKIIRVPNICVRITETEAYCWPHDSANHSFKGKTERNASMWGPPGHAYVYLCYGLHMMLNFVTNVEGQAAAVLVRSVDVIFGLDHIEKRRGQVPYKSLLDGPGKVAKALAIHRRHDSQPLFGGGEILVCDAPSVSEILVGPRVGIEYAMEKDRHALLRFADKSASFVSHRRRLIDDVVP